MFSLSTSWNAHKHDNGLDIVKEIKALGFDTIELSFALTLRIVNDVLKLKEKGEIKVSSLHNMCPIPPEILRKKASPDYYSLSSLDEKERALAVKAAKNTVDYAKMFGAKAVVFHIGRVEIEERTRGLASLINDKEKFKSAKNEMIYERESKKDSHIKRAIESLKDIVPYAKRIGVAPAVENRYYYREIPLIEELEEIFGYFEEGDLFYWHDVGHAEVFERLGMARHKDFMDKFSRRLFGIHLHDIIGSIEDHKAPGTGTFDFNILKPYITKDAIKVIEPHQPATGEEILHSVGYLTKIFGE